MGYSFPRIVVRTNIIPVGGGFSHRLEILQTIKCAINATPYEGGGGLKCTTRDRWLTVDEEMRLFNAAAPWLRELMLFAIHSGMRMGEILGLTWAEVDLFRRTVMVFKSKNGERRTIPLNQTALELLKHKYGSRSVETELVFPSEALTRLNASNISRSLHLALKKAKMTDFHFHDLRHTCATRMVQAGVDLYKVQRLLGHKSPIMTQRYAHHYPESLRDGIEVLDVGRGFSTNLAQLRVVPQGDSATC